MLLYCLDIFTFQCYATFLKNEVTLTLLVLPPETLSPLSSVSPQKDSISSGKCRDENQNETVAIRKG